MKSFSPIRVVSTLAILAMAACSSEGPTSPVPFPSFDVVSGEPTAVVYVCKVGLDLATVGKTFGFTATATGGDVVTPSGTVVAQSYADIVPANIATLCHAVWLGPDQSWDIDLTVTENETPGYELVTVRVWDIYDFWAGGTSYTDYAPTDGSVTFAPGHGQIVILKNRNDTSFGCTPGYWRQDQHYDNWTGYDPTDLFSDVFGVGPAIPLGEAVQSKGGGNDQEALMRHAVAALLNAASPDVEYGLSEAEIIAVVQDAFDSGQFEPTKDLLAELNESGCLLD